MNPPAPARKVYFTERLPVHFIIWKRGSHETPVVHGIRNLAVKERLYSPRRADGTFDLSLEERLAHTESLLADRWDAVADDFVDLASDGMRRGLALFMALQILRHPTARERVVKVRRDLLEFAKTVPRGDLHDYCIEIEGKEWPVDLSTILDHPEESPTATFVTSIFASVMALADTLLKKRWAMLFNDEPVLVTSDNPVFVLNLDLDRNQFAKAGAMIVFPVSPTRALFLDDRQEPDAQYYPLSQERALQLNYWTWLSADNFIAFGREPGDVVKELNHVDALMFPDGEGIPR